jgi:hypothetical protein
MGQHVRGKLGPAGRIELVRLASTSRTPRSPGASRRAPITSRPTSPTSCGRTTSIARPSRRESASTTSAVRRRRSDALEGTCGQLRLRPGCGGQHAGEGGHELAAGGRRCLLAQPIAIAGSDEGLAVSVSPTIRRQTSSFTTNENGSAATSRRPRSACGGRWLEVRAGPAGGQSQDRGVPARGARRYNGNP